MSKIINCNVITAIQRKCLKIDHNLTFFVFSVLNVILAYFYYIFKLNFAYIFALKTINHRLVLENAELD